MSTDAEVKKEVTQTANGQEKKVSKTEVNTQSDAGLGFVEKDLENMEMIFSLARQGNGTENEANMYQIIVFKQQMISKIKNAIKSKE
jgi:hypothetical protein